MINIHRTARTAVLAFALVTALAGTAFASPAAHAAGTIALQGDYCQCVDYVARVYGLTGYPNAYLWNTYLRAHGGAQDNVPNVGDIVVWQPNFCAGTPPYTNDSHTAHFCSDPTFGHVNIVNSMTSNGDGTYNVYLYGTRQPDPGSYDTYTNTNCNNFAIRHVTPISSVLGELTFWRPPNF